MYFYFILFQAKKEIPIQEDDDIQALSKLHSFQQSMMTKAKPQPRHQQQPIFEVDDDEVESSDDAENINLEDSESSESENEFDVNLSSDDDEAVKIEDDESTVEFSPQAFAITDESSDEDEDNEYIPPPPPPSRVPSKQEHLGKLSENLLKPNTQVPKNKKEMRETLEITPIQEKRQQIRPLEEVKQKLEAQNQRIVDVPKHKKRPLVVIEGDSESESEEELLSTLQQLEALKRKEEERLKRKQKSKKGAAVQQQDLPLFQHQQAQQPAFSFQQQQQQPSPLTDKMIEKQNKLKNQFPIFLQQQQTTNDNLSDLNEKNLVSASTDLQFANYKQSKDLFLESDSVKLIDPDFLQDDESDTQFSQINLSLPPAPLQKTDSPVLNDALNQIKQLQSQMLNLVSQQETQKPKQDHSFEIQQNLMNKELPEVSQNNVKPDNHNQKQVIQQIQEIELSNQKADKSVQIEQKIYSQVSNEMEEGKLSCVNAQLPILSDICNLCKSEYGYLLDEDNWYLIGLAHGYKKEFQQLLDLIKDHLGQASYYLSFSSTNNVCLGSMNLDEKLSLNETLIRFTGESLRTFSMKDPMFQLDDLIQGKEFIIRGVWGNGFWMF